MGLTQDQNALASIIARMGKELTQARQYSEANVLGRLADQFSFLMLGATMAERGEFVKACGMLDLNHWQERVERDAGRVRAAYEREQARKLDAVMKAAALDSAARIQASSTGFIGFEKLPGETGKQATERYRQMAARGALPVAPVETPQRAAALFPESDEDDFIDWFEADRRRRQKPSES